MRGQIGSALAYLSPPLARLLAKAGPQPRTLVWQPQPPEAGDPAAARRLSGGVALFDGHVVDLRGSSIWSVDPPSPGWSDAVHGHGWIDDAAACPDPAVWTDLSAWMWEWLSRYGGGAGPGWKPDLTARRLTRWLAHSTHLLQGQQPDKSRAFFAALGVHVRHVEWSWRRTRPGAERIEAVAGLVHALLSLEGPGPAARRAIAELGTIAESTIAPDGAIASRNAEELVRVAGLLEWIGRSIRDSGLDVTKKQQEALARARLTALAVRHHGTICPRFHGSGANNANRSSRRADPGRTRDASMAMGYIRLQSDSVSVVIDAARPPAAPHDRTAHVSALGIELLSGCNPIVVSAGPGARTGHVHALASRRCDAHSAIMAGDRGPGQLTLAKSGRTRVTKEIETDRAALSARGTVTGQFSSNTTGEWAIAQSTLYVARNGLTLERRLHLATGGGRLAGEDTAIATDAEARSRVVRLFSGDAAEPCQIVSRFIVHPDIKTTPSISGRTVSLLLPDASRWLMRTDAEWLSLEPAEYFDENRSKPRATSAIVATAEILEYWGRIVWSFERIEHGKALAGADAGASQEVERGI
ncbi:MAG: heparinase II/III family protein [Pseudomonadota bacterium]